MIIIILHSKIPKEQGIMSQTQILNVIHEPPKDKIPKYYIYFKKN